MFRPRVIPVLLLKNGGLVKTKQFKNDVYIGDPINAVKIFNDKKADELVFLDIDASNQKRCIDVNTVSRIGNEAYMPFGVGGGIATVSQMKALIKAGAEKVIINTHAYLEPELISKGAKDLGSQSVLVSIDVKKNVWGKYEVFIFGGKQGTGVDPVEYAKKVEMMGAGEILINSIDRDGMMEGYDTKIIELIAREVNIPVIACGGAGKMLDFKNLINKTQVSAVAAGSLFVFHGSRNAVLINYPTKEEMLSLI